MNYRFVAIDVDGTLLDSNKNLSPYTKETIQRCIAKGITVCCPTTMDSFAFLDNANIGLHLLIFFHFLNYIINIVYT